MTEDEKTDNGWPLYGYVSDNAPGVNLNGGVIVPAGDPPAA